MDEYKRAFEAAVREYETLSAEHARTEARLAQLKQMIATLGKLCGYEPTVPLGLTDACRLVLRNARQALTALEVRDRLGAIGIDLGSYANPLAAIHTVLKRLVESGEILERDRDEDDRAVYAFALPHVVASRVGPLAKLAGRRFTGEGLCPPKDRPKNRKNR